MTSTFVESLMIKEFGIMIKNAEGDLVLEEKWG